MLNLQNTLTRLQLIVLSNTYGADDVSDTMDLLRSNSHLSHSDPNGGYFAKCSQRL